MLISDCHKAQSVVCLSLDFYSLIAYITPQNVTFCFFEMFEKKNSSKRKDEGFSNKRKDEGASNCQGTPVECEAVCP